MSDLSDEVRNAVDDAGYDLVKRPVPIPDSVDLVALQADISTYTDLDEYYQSAALRIPLFGGQVLVFESGVYMWESPFGDGVDLAQTDPGQYRAVFDALVKHGVIETESRSDAE